MNSCVAFFLTTGEPTRLVEAEVKHVILYLKRTEGYGLLLPYQRCRSKKAETLGQVEDLHGQRQ